MDSNDKYKSTVGFIDLLFNVLVGFVFLFVIAFILINPIAKKGDIPSPAQFIVTLTWPSDVNHDLDLWVQDPVGNTVGFTTKDKGIMNLDRDDLGASNDRVVVDDQLIVVPINQEVITLRGIVPGQYYVNVHFYRRNAFQTVDVFPATITVIKINPYSIVYTQEKTFKTEGQIEKFYAFTVDEYGRISDLNEPNISIVPILASQP